MSLGLLFPCRGCISVCGAHIYHYINVLVIITMFWSPQLHSFVVHNIALTIVSRSQKLAFDVRVWLCKTTITKHLRWAGNHCKNVLVTLPCFGHCAWHIKFKECLQFQQNVVEKLPSFVEFIVSPFRKSTNQHSCWSLLSSTSVSGEFLGMAVIRNAINVAK